MNLVMRGSVIGNLPVWANDWKNGMTEPLDPITLPYLTTENFVSFFPVYEFPAMNNLSEVSLVAPYRLEGLLALSVDKATTLLTP